MINEARIFDIKSMSSEQLAALSMRILVMRHWPRGVSRRDVNIWLPDAGPSLELLSEYQRGAMPWVDFEQRYLDEQKQQMTCRVVRYENGEKFSDVRVERQPIKALRDYEQLYKTITLMCWEQGMCCHRHVLKAVLEEVYV